MSERLDAIEVKVAYLEQANAQLSDVVYRQHREIEALRLRLDALKSRIETVQQPTSYTPEQEKPPHY